MGQSKTEGFVSCLVGICVVNYGVEAMVKETEDDVRLTFSRSRVYLPEDCRNSHAVDLEYNYFHSRGQPSLD